MLGLSECVALFTAFLMLVLVFPLPRVVLETLLGFKPSWILVLLSAATSLVPFLESAKLIYEYRSVGYESDPSWMAAQVGLYRSLVVGSLLFSFVLLQHTCSRLVSAMVKEERMAKNLFATQKQAKAASDQSLKMLDMIDKEGTDKNVEMILSENVELKESNKELAKELSIIKGQAKAFNREHDRLIEEVHVLQTKLGMNKNEDKKDK